MLWVVLLSSAAHAWVTRFEFTRQLQEAQCNQCYAKTAFLDESEWSIYSNSPLYWVEDIDYEWNEYYACIEKTVIDDLMQWYPKLTSPFCPWRFCGGANSIAIDVAEAVIALLREEIANTEEIPVRSIQETQKQQPFLSVKQLGVIQNIQRRCESTLNKCLVESAQELDVLMRWWNQATVSAPYADTNRWRTQVLLRRIWVDWSWVSSLQALSQESINEILYPVQQKFSCDWNQKDEIRQVDSDQDWIIDTRDLCPRKYDPFQFDEDWDWKGDVCDSDIDNDGQENVLWIVDFQWRIDQYKLLNSNDKTPWWLGSTSNTQKVTLNQNSKRVRKWEIVSINTNWTIIDYGDGFQWVQDTHVYTQEWRYTIRGRNNAVQVVVDQWKKQIAWRIVWWPLTLDSWENAELAVEIFGDEVERIVREWWSEQEVASLDTSMSISQIWDNRNTPVRARMLDKQWEEYWILQTTLANWWYEENPWSQLESSTLNSQVNEPVDFDTNWMWWWVGNVRYIEWYINDEFVEQVYSQDTRRHQFSVPWIYEVVQKIYFKDRTKLPHTNVLFVYIDWRPSPIVSLNVPDTVLIGQQIEAVLTFEEWVFDDLISRERIVDWRKTGAFGSRYEYLPEWLWSVSISGRWRDQYWQGVYLSERIQVIVNDPCLVVGEYLCDMDSDGISDICDSDIDGDEIENPLWILIDENDDCAITVDVINEQILRESQGRSWVDVCPFVFDPEQIDATNDWIWNECESLMEWKEMCYDTLDNDGDGDIDCDDDDCSSLPICTTTQTEEWSNDLSDQDNNTWWTSWDANTDADNDGIPDEEDGCPWVSGGSWWCPELPDSESTGTESWTQIINPPCVTCPCPTIDRRAQLWQWDQVRALLYDESWTILYTHSQPYPIAP